MMSCNGPPLLTLANESNNNNLSTEQELMREINRYWTTVRTGQ